MILSGTVVSIDNVACDSVDVTLAVQQPYPGNVTLHVNSDVGAGYLADEWYGTFRVDSEVEIAVEDSDSLTVTGFRVGSYQRGYLL